MSVDTRYQQDQMDATTMTSDRNSKLSEGTKIEDLRETFCQKHDHSLNNGYSTNNDSTYSDMENGPIGEHGFMNGHVASEMAQFDKERYEKYIAPFDLVESDLRKMMEIMEREMKIGLSREGHLKGTPLQMENTYVSELLNGSEHGSYLAIDLGGTRFRVHYIQVKEGKIVAETTPYPLTTEIIHGPGKELFRHMAKCLRMFVEEKGLTEICHTLSLGFCFSFPIIQKALDSGLLLTWTKDFKCPGVEGNDVVAMLNEAIKEQHLDIKISAILNDSTGTLVAGSLIDKACCMSVIIGTGCNAAYLEKVENIGTWEGDKNAKDKYSVIDMEWGAFSDNGVLDFLKTPFDKEVDAQSKHPGSFTFEKLFSGLYLGEVFRVILSTAHSSGYIFRGYKSEKMPNGDCAPHSNTTNQNNGLHTNKSEAKGSASKKGETIPPKGTDQLAPNIYVPWSIPTKFVSSIEGEDSQGKSEQMTQFLSEAGLLQYTSKEDARFLKELSVVLIERAAKLVAAAIATVLKKMNRTDNGVAIDGSMYKLVPRLDRMIKHWVNFLYPAQTRIFLSEDGSGKGAALVAAIADRLPQNQSQHINNNNYNNTSKPANITSHKIKN